MAYLTEENEKDWRLATAIAGKALDYGRLLIKPGEKLLTVTQKVEQFIFDNGGKLGFPVNISLNSTAAHNVAKHNDDYVFKDDLVKLDLGVHVNGWIGDNACTIDLSRKHEKLINASRDALNNAVKLIKPGVTFDQVGKVIDSTILKTGCKTVRNLSGHTIDRYIIHAGFTVPNVSNGDETKFSQGLVIAIEPFATDGMGLIHEQGTAEIFNLVGFKNSRIAFVREIMKHIQQTYLTMPFSRRALLLKYSMGQVSYALKEFEQLDILHKYPPLVERNNGMVAQSEYTVLVTKDGCEVLTKNSFSEKC